MSFSCLRALLFVPGSARRLRKIPQLDPDAFILDLEDAVPPGEKAAARGLVASSLKDVTRAMRIVRVNSDPSTLMLDLDAVVGVHVDAVMLPKVDNAEVVDSLARQLAALESARCLEPSSVKILALVESARGVASCEAIAMAAPGRLAALCFGPGDLVTDLRITPSAGGSELAYARSRIVVAARAAGLPSPIDGPFSSVRDIEGLTADSIRSSAFGFQGRMVLHPSHIDPARTAYGTASDDELSFAARVVAAFDEQLTHGVGTAVVDDVFVDEPVYRRYRTMLNRSTRGASSTPATPWDVGNTGTGS